MTGFPDVNILQRTGTSGRALPGFDYYSGMMFYGVAPTGASTRWKSVAGNPTIDAVQIFSAADAISVGIVPYGDNLQANGSFKINTPATAAGEKLKIYIEFPVQNSALSQIDLGTYTTVSGDTTIATLGANLEAFINAGTINHGFVATFDTVDSVDIQAPAYFELGLEGEDILFNLTETDITVTVTAFSGGSISERALWYYHIKEYFRIFSSGGNLFIGVINESSAFEELNTLESFSNGKLRQIACVDIESSRGSGASISSTILQVGLAAKKSTQTQPYVVVYSPNAQTVSDWSEYPDQNINISNLVQCVISQDGAAEGALLSVRQRRTIGNAGVKLATIAISRVSASDAQPIDAFNVSNGTENNVPAFANAQLSSVVDPNLQVQLQNYNYTFFRTWGDVKVGTYWNDNRCCISNSSDYAYINDNRTFQKVSRICRQTYVPMLSSEILFNPDGTLSDEAIEAMRDAGVDAITANMITGYGVLPLISGVDIEIDASQDVKATNNLTVVVTIVQNGIARKITVDIGYGTISA